MEKSNNDNVLNIRSNNDNDNDAELSHANICYYARCCKAFLSDEYEGGCITMLNIQSLLNTSLSRISQFLYYWSSLTDNERREVANSIPYSDYLRTSYWLYVSTQAKLSAGFACEKCGVRRSKYLSVHHKTYDHIGSEYKYMEDLEVLCNECHMKTHGMEK